jgi:hypothetical protein
MPTVTVRRTIAAPIEDVFEWLSTATNYPKSRAILRSTLATPGDDGGFGNGAVREVTALVGWFREEISAHQRPYAFDYLILQSVPPLTHRSGQMRFREVPAGTEVTWTSVFDVPLPVAGGAVGRMLGPLAHAAFGSVLRAADRDLTGSRRRA